ncbi:ATP-binding protein [Halomonas sp. PAMB 3264]|uniref:sensor histidine kinase n=1 Tax=Halomonas sp. PAMB 3264 TaxID=3075222 RepID=UPI00289B1C2B|nr:ATP-binding protein [Halomonas sp. PAMB 3264]WNL42989.1 ATP-binding protein [Halomonas sp. PAMB 3264]
MKSTALAFVVLLLLTLCACQAATAAAPLRPGLDLPYQVLADAPGQQTLNDMAPRLARAPRLPPSPVFSRGYTDSVWWLRFTLPASALANAPLWMTIRPNFLDDVRVYYRPVGPADMPELSRDNRGTSSSERALNEDGSAWQERRFGDTVETARDDVHYRFPLLQFPPLPESAEAYEVVIRLASTSSLMLRLELSPPASFLSQAARSTAWYGAYFGMAAIATLLALVLSMTLGGRLLWSLTATAIPYLSLACVEGFIAWWWPWQGHLVQHYLVSVLALLMYPALLWMPAEAIGLRTYMPRIYRLFLASCALAALLLLSIPLGFYGVAIRLQTAIYVVTGVIFIVAFFRIQRLEQLSPMTLLLGAGPFMFLVVSLLGMLALAGLLPFEQALYLLWQNVLLLNMLLVMGVAVYRIRSQHRQVRERARLVRELSVERKARFHQRQFMGMVAHEFRTPLAVISACVENLQSAAASDATQKRHERLRRATERLTQLTDSCLVDARLDADELLIDRVPTDLTEVIYSALSLIHFSEHHQWQFTINGRPHDDTHGTQTSPVSIDPAMMRIALSNVIDNAVKYSPSGVIRIDYRQGTHGCTVSIEDQGPGIADEHRQLVFERYRRGEIEQATQRGVGLGLYLARRIARAHGGELSLEPRVPTGCRFVFTLAQA